MKTKPLYPGCLMNCHSYTPLAVIKGYIDVMGSLWQGISGSINESISSIKS
jgi:hypothetical protein